MGLFLGGVELLVEHFGDCRWWEVLEDGGRWGRLESEVTVGGLVTVGTAGTGFVVVEYEVLARNVVFYQHFSVWLYG